MGGHVLLGRNHGMDTAKQLYQLIKQKDMWASFRHSLGLTMANVGHLFSRTDLQ